MYREGNKWGGVFTDSEYEFDTLNTPKISH